MANVFRYRYGDTNPISVPVDTGTVIEIGDLLFLDTDDAKPASDVGNLFAEDAMQEAFALLFLGVAMQASASGDTKNIRVATTGVFEFICTSATYVAGDLVGPNYDTTVLEDQTVEKVGNTKINQAVGCAEKSYASATTLLLTRITSVVMEGGKQLQTAS